MKYLTVSMMVFFLSAPPVLGEEWPTKKTIRTWANEAKAGFIRAGIYEINWIDGPGKGTIVVEVTEDTKKKLCDVIALAVGISFRNTFKYQKFLGVHVWEEGAWWETTAKHWYENKLIK